MGDDLGLATAKVTWKSAHTAANRICRTRFVRKPELAHELTRRPARLNRQAEVRM